MPDDRRVGFDEDEWRRVADNAAEIYERVLVPGVFAAWVEPMLTAASVGEGDEVLDVACGTGVLTRRAAEVVRSTGSVTGLDLTPAMIDVAASIDPDIDWRIGDALELPFPRESFDVVLCQAGMMFFPDRVRAVREMRRVLRPGGRLAVLVWAESAGQEAFAQVLHEQVSPDAANRYRAPWSMANRQELHRTLVEGGFPEAVVETRSGSSRYPSIEVFLASTTILLAGEEEPSALTAAAEAALADYVAADGSIEIPGPAHIATAVKRRRKTSDPADRGTPRPPDATGLA